MKMKTGVKFNVGHAQSLPIKLILKVRMEGNEKELG